MRVISVVWSSFVLIIVQVIWAKKRNFVAKGNCDKNGLSGADIKYLNLYNVPGARRLFVYLCLYYNLLLTINSHIVKL